MSRSLPCVSVRVARELDRVTKATKVMTLARNIDHPSRLTLPSPLPQAIWNSRTNILSYHWTQPTLEGVQSLSTLTPRKH